MNNECLMCHAIIAPGHVYCDKCAITVTNHGAHTPQWPLANCQRCNNLIDSDWNLCGPCSLETGVPRDGQWPVCQSASVDLKPCRERGECRIAYGCLDAHIGEKRMCKEHARLWWRGAVEGALFCDTCGEPAAELVVEHDGQQEWRQLPVGV